MYRLRLPSGISMTMGKFYFSRMSDILVKTNWSRFNVYTACEDVLDSEGDLTKETDPSSVSEVKHNGSVNKSAKGRVTGIA